MSAHVLLNLLNELGKKIKCEACPAFYLFFATSLINSLIQEHVCEILFIIRHLDYFNMISVLMLNYFKLVIWNYSENGKKITP